MNLNESNPKLRTISARLTDLAGNPLPLNHVFSAGDLKVLQPDGTIANAANLPAAVAAGGAGSFDIVIAQAELQQAGNIRAQLNASGVAYWEWVEPVGVAVTATVDANAIAAAVYAQVSTAGGLTINVARFQPVVTGITSYDVGDVEPALQFDLPFDGISGHATLATAVSAQLRWKKPDGTVSTVAMTIADTTLRRVQRVWSAGDLDQAGVHSGEVIITWPGPRVQTVQTVYQWTVRAPLA